MKSRNSLKKKNILYILDPSKDITGAFICAKNESFLLKEDFDIVLVLPSLSKISDEDMKSFSKVIRLPIFDIRKSLGSILLYFPALFVAGWKLRKAMKKDKCQYLQVNDYYMMQGVVARLFGYRGKIVTWVRIDPTRYGSFFSKYWLKYAYRVSDIVVAVSQFILNMLPESPKNRLLYDPVGDDLSANLNKKDHEVKKLIYIGNYTEGKGQQHAIKAFEKLANEFEDVKLHFYGGVIGLKKNKIYKDSLQSLAQNTPYVNRIFFHGFVKDTADVLKDGYMALNFSESESFSLTCLEASCAGLSVVATKSGGPEEIIIDGETGYLVGKGDIDAMVDAMRKLLSDRTKNKQFGKYAALHVRKTFSPKSFQKNIKDLFMGESN